MRLDELDIYSPETTYIRMGDGQYYQADWRKNQNMGGKDTASFVKIKPLDDSKAKQLGLDNRLKSKNTEIAKGGPIQGNNPLGPRRVTVIDFGDNSPEGKKAMDAFPQKVKQELVKVVK